MKDMKDVIRDRKAFIKGYALKLWDIMDVLTNLKMGYKISEELTHDDNWRIIDGVKSFSISYRVQHVGDVCLFYDAHGRKGQAVSGKSEYGRDLVDIVDENLVRVLAAFVDDPDLYRLYRSISWDYDDRLVVVDEHEISPMDFNDMKDRYYNEVRYTINRKGMVFSSKPKMGRDSVLVALNID